MNTFLIQSSRFLISCHSPGLLAEQEGVGVRGARSAQALGLRVYRLSDVEEDDDMPRLPHSSHVYTFTNR